MPEIFFKINYPVTFNGQSFTFQQLLHDVGAPEMIFSCKHPIAVNHPVCRDIFGVAVRCIHGPANHPCRTSCPQIFGYCTVGGYFAVRNLLNHLINFFEK